MGFKSVMNKELARVFKDKKLIFSMFILPIILMVGMFFIIFSLVSNMTKEIKTHVSSVYVQNAPESFRQLMKSAEDMEIRYIDGSEDLDIIKDNIKNGNTDLLIAFPEDFEARISSGDTNIPQIMTFYNPSEDDSSEARNRMVGNYIEAYRQAFITDKFGSLESVIIFGVDIDNPESEVVDPDKAAGKMLGTILPYFITIMIFAGAMSLGVDAIAGEKERGTLASMLLAPISRFEIVMGKIVALGLLSILSAFVYVIGMLIAFSFGVSKVGAEAEILSNLSVSFTPVQIIQIIVLMLGSVIMYVALIGLLSVIAKNVKEAQTYIMPAYILVIAAGMFSMYSTDNSSMTGYLIPFVNSSFAFKGIITQEITMAQFGVSTAMTYAVAFLMIALMAKAFNSEKIMFNA